MKPIRHTIWMVLLVGGATQAQITDEQASAIASDWNSAVEASSKGLIDAQTLRGFWKRYRGFLTSAVSTPSQIHLQEKGAESHIELTLAQAWASAGDFSKAAQYLEAQIAIQRQSGGDFLQSASSRNRDALVNDVLELHSEILANIGASVAVPGSGYEIFAVPSGDGKSRFAFVYRVEGTEEAQVELEGLNEDEERRMIRLSEPDSSNHFHLVDRAQIIGKHDQITITTKPTADGLVVTFGGGTKFMEYNRFGIPKVRSTPQNQIELRVGDGKIEQPLAAIERAATPQKNQGASTTSSKTAVQTAPSISLPPTKAKQSGQLTEPPNAVSWKIWLGIGVAALFLLGAWIKKHR